MPGRLARVLEEAAPDIPGPVEELEQYPTPPEIALYIARHASLSGVLEGSIAADLGAGTCRLGLALLMMGASKIVAVDVDSRLSRPCLDAARRLGLGGRLVYVASLIEGAQGPLRPGCLDLVVLNPPFGVRGRWRDWDLLGYALGLGAGSVYAVLKHGNIEYHARRAREQGYEAALLETLDFPLKASMPGHRARVKRIPVDVVLFRKPA